MAAFIRQRFCNGATNAFGGPSNQGDLIFEL
jgi:hypothetical protein